MYVSNQKLNIFKCCLCNKLTSEDDKNMHKWKQVLAKANKCEPAMAQ